MFIILFVDNNIVILVVTCINDGFNSGHTEGVMVFNATFNNISVILLWSYSMYKLPFFLQAPFLTTDQHI